MGILHAICSTIKQTDYCLIGVDQAGVSISASTPYYTVSATVPMECRGTDQPHGYQTQAVLGCTAHASRLEEDRGTLSFVHQAPAVSLKRTIQPVVTPLAVPAVPTEYTAKLSLKVCLFKKIISLLKDAQVCLYLANGVLFITSGTAEGEDIIKVPAVQITKEGTDKVCIYPQALKITSSLLPHCEQVVVAYSSSYLSLLLVFNHDIAHYQVVANSIPWE